MASAGRNHLRDVTDSTSNCESSVPEVPRVPLKPEARRTAMAVLTTRSSTAEIDASIERVWALVEDMERTPTNWQGKG